MPSASELSDHLSNVNVGKAVKPEPHPTWALTPAALLPRSLHSQPILMTSLPTRLVIAVQLNKIYFLCFQEDAKEKCSNTHTCMHFSSQPVQDSSTPATTWQYSCVLAQSRQPAFTSKPLSSR